MFCPEGYFTPKMLAEAFRKSLTREDIRTQIFNASEQSSANFQTVHLGEIIVSCADLLMMHFVQSAANEIRLCDAEFGTLRRTDPWPLRLGECLPSRLPETIEDAQKFMAGAPKLLPLIDIEMWVIDCDAISHLGKSNADFSKFARLFEPFDGWSVCLPQDVYPQDLGFAMKNVVVSNATSRMTIPQLTTHAGRPRKLETAVSAIRQAYPQGVGTVSAKVIGQAIRPDLGLSIGDTLLREAIKASKIAS